MEFYLKSENYKKKKKTALSRQNPESQWLVNVSESSYQAGTNGNTA